MPENDSPNEVEVAPEKITPSEEEPGVEAGNETPDKDAADDTATPENESPSEVEKGTEPENKSNREPLDVMKDLMKSRNARIVFGGCCVGLILIIVIAVSVTPSSTESESHDDMAVSATMKSQATTSSVGKLVTSAAESTTKQSQRPQTKPNEQPTTAQMTTRQPTTTMEPITTSMPRTFPVPPSSYVKTFIMIIEPHKANGRPLTDCEDDSFHVPVSFVTFGFVDPHYYRASRDNTTVPGDGDLCEYEFNVSISLRDYKRLLWLGIPQFLENENLIPRLIAYVEITAAAREDKVRVKSMRFDEETLQMLRDYIEGRTVEPQAPSLYYNGVQESWKITEELLQNPVNRDYYKYVPMFHFVWEVYEMNGEPVTVGLALEDVGRTISTEDYFRDLGLRDSLEYERRINTNVTGKAVWEVEYDVSLRISQNRELLWIGIPQFLDNENLIPRLKGYFDLLHRGSRDVTRIKSIEIYEEPMQVLRDLYQGGAVEPIAPQYFNRMVNESWQITEEVIQKPLEYDAENYLLIV